MMATRVEEVKAQRRRRDSAALGGHRNRLYVDESTLDREMYEYRWVNDDPDRLHALTVLDDWDIVQDRGASGATASMGTELAHNAGTIHTGKAGRAVLLRKPKDLYDEDEMKKQRQIDVGEAAIRQGATPGTDTNGFYKPKGGITIG